MLGLDPNYLASVYKFPFCIVYYFSFFSFLSLSLFLAYSSSTGYTLSPILFKAPVPNLMKAFFTGNMPLDSKFLKPKIVNFT